MSKCSIDGCDNPVEGHGWCNKHYQRWRAHGDPLTCLIRPDGTGSITHDGYHLRTENGVKRKEHVRIAERALGKPLPPGTVVHHVDENGLNNDPTNLVICTRAYHNLIHQRLRAFAACGHYDWRPCNYCGQHDDLSNMSGYKSKNSVAYRHPRCNSDYTKAQRIKKAASAALFFDKAALPPEQPAHTKPEGNAS